MARPGSMGGRALRQDESVLQEKINPGTTRRILQFALPYSGLLVLFLAIVALGAGVGVINPLAAALYSRHETLEAEVFQGRGSQMAVSGTIKHRIDNAAIRRRQRAVSCARANPAVEATTTVMGTARAATKMELRAKPRTSITSKMAR